MDKLKQVNFGYDVLIISDDVVGSRMAGPGIRCWEMANVLAKYFRVALAIPDYSYISDEDHLFKNIPFDIFGYSLARPEVLRKLAFCSRIAIIQGYILSKFPFLAKVPIHLIVDVYIPFVLENIFTHRSTTANLKDRQAIHLHDLRVFNTQLRHGDHFLCASSRQRDLIFGCLLSLNRITPQLVDQLSTFDDIISIVPFGIEETEATSGLKFRPLRRLFPQIGEKDKIILWGGVLTNWFDPITLLYAFHEAVQIEPRLKLVFLSTVHPNPLLPEFTMAKKAMDLAKELGLLNRHVFFNQAWINYSERSAYFFEADIGISIHLKHLETEYSFRTRILDYIKHELPIICTEGDYFADLVNKEGLGIVVPVGGKDEIKEAMLILVRDDLRREKIKERIRKVKERFFWTRVLEPLITHCKKVIDGEALIWNRPKKNELKYACLPGNESSVKRLLKKLLGNRWQKLSWKMIARWRRIFG
jgi:glycosyltransferase involved in cell wall biosynthesis